SASEAQGGAAEPLPDPREIERQTVRRRRNERDARGVPARQQEHDRDRERGHRAMEPQQPEPLAPDGAEKPGEIEGPRPARAGRRPGQRRPGRPEVRSFGGPSSRDAKVEPRGAVALLPVRHRVAAITSAAAVAISIKKRVLLVRARPTLPGFGGREAITMASPASIRPAWPLLTASPFARST